jgi:hypothetical protein
MDNYPNHGECIEDYGFYPEDHEECIEEEYSPVTITDILVLLQAIMVMISTITMVVRF